MRQILNMFILTYQTMKIKRYKTKLFTIQYKNLNLHKLE